MRNLQEIILINSKTFQDYKESITKQGYTITDEKQAEKYYNSAKNGVN